MGSLYVDDTRHQWEGLEEDDDMISTAAKGQAAIADWGGYLGATGGAQRETSAGLRFIINHRMVERAGCVQISKNGVRDERQTRKIRSWS